MGCNSEWINIGISVLTLSTVVITLYMAIRAFGLHREKYTFLTMGLDADVIVERNKSLLVSVRVRLENKGQTRISCRRHKDVKSGQKGWIYADDEWDRCKHSGTLKIRGVLGESGMKLVDWYSLQPITDAHLMSNGKESIGDLEQINYLDEFQDITTDWKDTDFWMEPNESYDISTMIWLPPGIYAMKAYFFGPTTELGESEYWSCTRVFSFAGKEERSVTT